MDRFLDEQDEIKGEECEYCKDIFYSGIEFDKEVFCCETCLVGHLMKVGTAKTIEI